MRDNEARRCVYADPLVQEVLVELLKSLRRENRLAEREGFERELAEIRARRFGYPVPRIRRRSWNR
jgi:hypothetical protein